MTDTAPSRGSGAARWRRFRLVLRSWYFPFPAAARPDRRYRSGFCHSCPECSHWPARPARPPACSIPDPDAGPARVAPQGRGRVKQARHLDAGAQRQRTGLAAGTPAGQPGWHHACPADCRNRRGTQRRESPPVTGSRPPLAPQAPGRAKAGQRPDPVQDCLRTPLGTPVSLRRPALRRGGHSGRYRPGRSAPCPACIRRAARSCSFE